MTPSRSKSAPKRQAKNSPLEHVRLDSYLSIDSLGWRTNRKQPAVGDGLLYTDPARRSRDVSSFHPDVR